MTAEELFLLIDLDDSAKKRVKNIIKEESIDPSLIYFIYRKLSFENQNLPLQFLDEIIKRLAEKGIKNQEEALIYFGRKEEQLLEKSSLSQLIERFNSMSIKPLSKNELKRVSRFQFDYNVDYDLINHALDIAYANNRVSVKYLEGILKNWEKLNIHDMLDYMEYIATQKKWDKDMY